MYKNQQWQRKAANTIAINVLYIDDAHSLYDLYDNAPSLWVLEFATLVEPSFVIITIYLNCLIHAWK